MTHHDLSILLDFNYWARDRSLEAAAVLTPAQFTQDLGNSFKSIRDTLVHTFSAECVWHARWLGESPTSPLNFADYPDLATLRRAWAELEGQNRALLAAENDQTITRTMDYRLMNGQPGRSVFWHMVQHVVNHGSYHRGQVTTLLRQLGVPPPRSTDLIAYYREMHS
jgi:uncharacterized damage-inducible protein DinB